MDARTLRLVIGGLTFAYAAGQLVGVAPSFPATRRAAAYVGVLSGVLSSSVSMGGTPVMLYLLGLGGSTHDLRATAVAYVVLSTIGSLIVLAFTGLIDRSAFVDAAWLIPAGLVGFGAGALAFRHVTRTVFQRVTLVALAAMGLLALAAGLH